MDYFNAFLIGGLICLIAQVILDKTKLTSGRIMVLFVVIGCILTGLGLYQPLVEFAGAGAIIPIMGFGYLLTTGVMKEVDANGLIGIFSGGLKAAAVGLSFALICGFLMSLFFSSKEK